MSAAIRPWIMAFSLALAGPVAMAKPVKHLAKPKEAPVLELAHDLDPPDAERLQSVVDRFNAESGSKLKLVRLEKGGKPADLNLVRSHGMSELLGNKKNFLPLYAMMAKERQHLDARSLPEDLKAGVVDRHGRLVALPLLYSTPVLFYNKNAFRKAGLDPEHPPATWFEMQGMLDKLQSAGYKCPYTTSWPVWVHIDNVSAVSGVPAVNDKGALAFNGLPQVKHIAMMATWVRAGYFRLYGRGDEASTHFHDGECAMITTDSREYTDFRDARGVELGVAPMPYHDDIYGGRQSSLADGASLWIGAGRSRAEYQEAAKFVSFLMAPATQVETVRAYGGLPLTAAARAAAKTQILREGEKTLEVAYASLGGKGRDVRRYVADIDPVRNLIDDELEAVWADKEPPKEALDRAVARGNALLSANPELKNAQPF